jgi:hypothetical protein
LIEFSGAETGTKKKTKPIRIEKGHRSVAYLKEQLKMAEKMP